MKITNIQDMGKIKKKINMKYKDRIENEGKQK